MDEKTITEWALAQGYSPYQVSEYYDEMVFEYEAAHGLH